MPINTKIIIAKKVITQEITALKKLSNHLDTSFIKAVDLIHGCKGKVIATGVGKSGHIMRKISATLSSTGTSSVFLNPGDASHGDLGLVDTRQDIFLIMSYSGNTDELKNIINFAKNFKVPIIGVASKDNSALIKASTIKILIPKVQEAGLDIVPTSSSTIQMVLGDCLAVCLMNKKKFNKENFALFHPSGSLGKQLIIVKNLMIKGADLPFVFENEKIKKAIIEITKKTLGCVLVRNSKKKITGILTDGDVRRQINKKDFLEKIIKNFMTKKPLIIEENTLAVKALEIMNKKKITSLIVKSKNNQYGLIHIHHLLALGI
ncbi:MAG: SIS domain-containing protein [Candidatus Fonsibacter sp.]|jgi:arabinose-5-phosphate isomerase|nr:KpsF/GutQ family sugar-phosphate isomerase [Pelagibacterales bacterium]